LLQNRCAELRGAEEPAIRPTRRAFLKTGSLAVAAAPLAAAPALAESHADSFADILRQPDLVQVYANAGTADVLRLRGTDWAGDDGVTVSLTPSAVRTPITVTAPRGPLQRILLRWNTSADPTLRVLGDAWERSYGDLGWRELIPERPMPWYFLSWDGRALHGYGVETGAGALAFWLRDRDGISLWLDVRNGGEGVLLGGRTLAAASVITRRGNADHEPVAAAHAFCRSLCTHPRLLRSPVFGSNDWYYAYGHNTEAGILRDAALMRELAPTSGPKPFTVIDDGYQDPARFPDLPDLPAKIRAKGVRPGIWVRPLRAALGTSPALLLPAARFGGAADAPAYDPTIPEARAHALEVVSQAAGWDFELIKHDFTTWELLGRWGFQMGASPTLPGWHLYDRTRTNAEILTDLYRGIRAAAGERLILSCNVVGHLGAGFFEMQRTGDDVSGKVWERTRRMGVNTLGFRLPQNRAFFTNDADCVAITPAIPWDKTLQWLDAVTRSGTLLLVSPDPASMGAEQKQAVRAAFAVASAGQADAPPIDWLQTHTPSKWRGRTDEATYQWLEPAGADPFTV
jgi:alpha-galactosidase